MSISSSVKYLIFTIDTAKLRMTVFTFFVAVIRGDVFDEGFL